MRKKIFFILAACGAAVLLAGAVVFFQFKGNAVRAESELFVSAQADYGQLADSLCTCLTCTYARIQRVCLVPMVARRKC